MKNAKNGGSKQGLSHKPRPEIRDDLDSRSQKDERAKEKESAKREDREIDLDKDDEK